VRGRVLVGQKDGELGTRIWGWGWRTWCEVGALGGFGGFRE